MNSQGEVLRPTECAMALESARASVELLRCIEEVLTAGRALAELVGTTWNHPVVDAWIDAADHGADVLEAVTAYETYPPTNWW